MLIITPSAIRAAQTCLKKYHYRYELLRKALTEVTFAMQRGTNVHNALEAFYKTGKINLACSNYEEAQLAAMIHGYVALNRDKNFQLLDVEKEFYVPSKTGLFALAGKMDRVFQDKAGLVWITETKTTSSGIEPGGFYHQQKAIDIQIGLYGLIVPIVYPGNSLGGVIYDVLYTGHPKPRKAVEKPRTNKDGTLRKGQQIADETPAEYYQRLNGLITKDPERYYQRYQFTYTLEEKRKLASDLTDWVQIIQSEKRPRNSVGCWQYNRACVYFDVCTGREDINDNRKFLDAILHEELELEGIRK